MKVKGIHIKHQLITGLLCGLFLTGVVAYMYFLSVSVVQVVLRKEATQEIAMLRSEIANLEASYITAHHTISSRVATTEGFSEIKSKIFINESVRENLVLRSANE